MRLKVFPAFTGSMIACEQPWSALIKRPEPNIFTTREDNYEKNNAQIGGRKSRVDNFMAARHSTTDFIDPVSYPWLYMSERED